MKLDDNNGEKVQNCPIKYEVSLEKEAYQIVYQAIPTSQKISTIFLNHFGHENGIDLVTRKQHRLHNPMYLSY